MRKVETLLTNGFKSGELKYQSGVRPTSATDLIDIEYLNLDKDFGWTPFLIPSWYDPSVKIVRFMVDPTNGDDTKDGLCWANAKKTINSVLSAFPNKNLNKHSVFIFIKSGTLLDTLFSNYYNGFIEVSKVGTTFLDPNPSPYMLWALNGETITTDNNPVIFTNSAVDKIPLRCENYVGSHDLGEDITINMIALNDRVSAWAAGYTYRRMFQVRANFDTGVYGALDLAAQVRFTSASMSFYLSSGVTVRAMIYFYNGGTFLNLDSPELYNEGGTVSYAAYCNWYNSDFSIFSLGQIGGSFGDAAGFAAVAKSKIYFQDFDKCIAIKTNSFNAFDNSNGAGIAYADVNQAYGKANIVIDNAANAGYKYLKYNSLQCNLTDNSTWTPRTAEDVNTSTIKKYISNNLIDNGSAFSLPNVPIVDPHVVGDVWNNAGILTVSAG